MVPHVIWFVALPHGFVLSVVYQEIIEVCLYHRTVVWLVICLLLYQDCHFSRYWPLPYAQQKKKGFKKFLRKLGLKQAVFVSKAHSLTKICPENNTLLK